MNQEPEYVKSDYELYVEEKRKRNAEHMKQWDIKAAKEQQQKKDAEPSHVPTTVVQDMTTEDNTTKTTHNYTSNNNTDHNAVDSSQELDVQDYRDENNWTVEFFVMHKEHTFTIKFNKKKIKYNGYTLKARWRGYDECDDTIEPLHNAASHHKEQLLAYIMQASNKDLITHIQENKYNLFENDLLEAITSQINK